ncbi:MAG: hypothetical protein IJZ39_10665 [Oscillospiraceae bacterium]|nr:hypothetical protein [Oscillospiraceae bacterium]
MRETMMLLAGHSRVSDYKVNITKKESYELFFVKGALETVRHTDTWDREVTVYVDHGEYRGASRFFIYPSTTFSQKADLINEAVEKASLIQNQKYDLPSRETGRFTVESNFENLEPAELAASIAKTVFEANTVENASLNAVEIFINKYSQRVINSRGLDKTQIRYDAMVEAIPTYNGQELSVELYEQCNFSNLDIEHLRKEIAGKMAEVKARFQATTPAEIKPCRVILNPLELSQLFWFLSDDLNYATVYGHSNLHTKGDMIQKNPTGDKLTVTMAGSIPGNVQSRCFDDDGMALTNTTIIEDGKVVNYFGANRFGQYLGEKPTGDLKCLKVAPGTVTDFQTGPYLEVVSMSAFQVDLYSDYVGGEVRLAYYHDGETIIPVTGVSFSGSLAQCLNTIRLSAKTVTQDGYTGPAKAILEGMNIY